MSQCRHDSSCRSKEQMHIAVQAIMADHRDHRASVPACQCQQIPRAGQDKEFQLPGQERSVPGAWRA